MGEEDG